MAAAFVQSTYNLGAAAGTTIIGTLGGAVASGGLVCGAVCCDGGVTVLTAIDDKLNNYTIVDTKTDVFNGNLLATFYKENITNAPTIITVTFSGLIADRGVVLHEASGIATSSALDQHATGEAKTSAVDGITTGNVTTTTAGQYIFCVAINTEDTVGDMSAGTGYTPRETHNGGGFFNLCSEDQIQSAAGLIAGTETCSSVRNCQVAMMTFIASGVSAPSIAQIMAAVGAHSASGGMYGRRWR